MTSPSSIPSSVGSLVSASQSALPISVESSPEPTNIILASTMSSTTGPSTASPSTTSTSPTSKPINPPESNTFNTNNNLLPTFPNPEDLPPDTTTYQIVCISVFYFAILVTGIWASKKAESSQKSKNKSKNGSALALENAVQNHARKTSASSNHTYQGETTDDVMLAGRNIGVLVGIFTMTATWVGGAYICGSSQVAYSSGILWMQAPFGYAISLFLGGILFAVPMRQQGYVTMLDPFQLKYGEIYGSLVIIPALVGEICWSAAILSALGATITVVLKLETNVSVIISACIAVFYTLAGGLYSVAYTDVIQLICILLGLVVAIPYALFQSDGTAISLSGMFDFSSINDAPAFTNNAILSEFAKNNTITISTWTGQVTNWGLWWDTALLLMFGGIPWQVYFQRVLSCDSSKNAKILSYVAGVGCFLRRFF